MSVGDNIKKRRLESNLTQKELSNKCNVSESSIKYYETGLRNPKRETLVKIAEALNCSVWDFIYPEEERIEFHNERIKEDLLESISKLVKNSGIELNKTYSNEEIVDKVLNPETNLYEPVYEPEMFNGVEIKYNNTTFKLNEKEYYKLADRIIESVVINILASKEYK